jgi:hypothetical protein
MEWRACRCTCDTHTIRRERVIRVAMRARVALPYGPVSTNLAVLWSLLAAPVLDDCARRRERAVANLPRPRSETDGELPPVMVEVKSWVVIGVREAHPVGEVGVPA